MIHLDLLRGHCYYTGLAPDITSVVVVRAFDKLDFIRCITTYTDISYAIHTRSCSLKFSPNTVT